MKNINFPLVSVIILTYNHSEFISDTIKSVLTQDYENLEVVISDDYSQDSTVEIIKSLEKVDRRIIGNYNKQNVGIVKNCNLALRKCSGEFVAFLGGDDLFNPGKITAQINWFLQDSQRVVCGHDTEVFENDTNKLLYIDKPKGRRLTVDSWISNGMILNAQSLMVRRSSIPNFGFDERLGIVADWKFVIDILLNGGVCGHVKGVYSRYRMHGNNITKLSRSISKTNFKQSYFDQLLTISHIEAFYPIFYKECQIRRYKLFVSNQILALKTKEFNFIYYYLRGSFLIVVLNIFFSRIGRILR